MCHGRILLVWLNLCTGALFGAQAAGRYADQGATGTFWLVLVAAVLFAVTGAGYFFRFRGHTRREAKRSPRQPSAVEALGEAPPGSAGPGAEAGRPDGLHSHPPGTESFACEPPPARGGDAGPGPGTLPQGEE